MFAAYFMVQGFHNSKIGFTFSLVYSEWNGWLWTLVSYVHANILTSR